MEAKCKKSGFTIVELLTVLAIIAMLVGLLIPSLAMVRNAAKETKQKSQFAAIDQALLAFRSDDGDYPPSGARNEIGPTGRYCGAQKLAEALLGWDLLGFHPQSAWRDDGRDALNGDGTYDRLGNRGDESLYQRVGPYLELSKANAFRLTDLFVSNIMPFTEDRFVLCDSFGIKKVPVPQTGGQTIVVKAGTPILYYRANTFSKTLIDPIYPNRIYSVFDNDDLVHLNRLPDRKDEHPLGVTANMYEVFYDFITDRKVLNTTGRQWPYRADSYILISAGRDGLYGTGDDITNFRN